MRSLALIAVCGALALSACHPDVEKPTPSQVRKPPAPALATKSVTGPWVYINDLASPVFKISPTPSSEKDFDPRTKVDELDDTFKACRDTLKAFVPTDVEKVRMLVTCINTQVAAGKDDFQLVESS